MKYAARVVSGDELLRYWPAVNCARGYPTVTAALEHTAVRGYSVLVLRLFGSEGKGGGILVNLSFQQVLEVCQGRDYTPVFPLWAQSCACKSKCSVVTNSILRTLAVSALETTGYGAHSTVSQAPALGLVLFSRWCFAEDGSWKKFVEPTDLSSFHARSFGKFSDRLRLFSRPQISIQARCVAFNTFVNSVMLYAISYFGITTRDLNYLRQSAVRLVLRRHWLEAEILPYVLKYVGISTLIDPALAATVAALGLFVRQGGNSHDLWADGSYNRQTVATRVLLNMWADYLPLEQLKAAIYRGNNDPRRTVGQVKLVISKSMQVVAQTVLLNKIRAEGWVGGISYQWIEGLSKVARKMCNGIARYAVLRWALNQDDDHWLANPGTRHQLPCARCGSRADCYPWGFYAAPMCDTCVVSLNLTAFTLAPYSQDLFTCLVAAAGHSQVDVHCEICPGGLAEQSTHQPGAPLQNVPSQIMVDATMQELEGRLPDNDLVCIACGCGDCTVGHWVRWCIVPIVAVHRLLGLKRYVGHLEEISRLSQRALTVCSLVVFHFRRLLRQEGAFLHQTCGERHSPVWWCRRICQEVSLNAHVQLRLRLEEHRRSGLACVCHEDGLTLVRTLPVHMSTFLRPPVIVQASRVCTRGDTIAKLRLDSVALAALHATEAGVQGGCPNVKTSYFLCACGEYHVNLEAANDIAQADLLSLCVEQPPVLFAQFDGSAHSQVGIGGAGAVLFLVSCRGLELVDWCSYALPQCADNVVAEAYGALAALQLYQAWTVGGKHGDNIPQLHAIQGDIKPLLQHLQFTGRLRRPDLISAIDDFHQAHSLIAPSCQMLYRPREANFLADYLAGKGSRYLLDLHRNGHAFPDAPTRVQATLPIDLLLRQQAILLGTHCSGKTVLCLVERTSCTSADLLDYTRHTDEHIARSAAQLLTATRSGVCPLVVEYVASAEDGKGRLYARQWSGQRTPRTLRLAVYGRGHQEIDMVGAHYEIIRRSITGSTLPPIQQLRAQLRAEWHGKVGLNLEEVVKLWPLYIINGGLVAAAGLLLSHQLVASPAALAIAYELEAAQAVFTASILPKHRGRLTTTFSNRAFFAIEHIECLVMQTFLRQLQMRVTLASVLWLHDGIWIPDTVTKADIRFAERATLQEFSLTNDDTVFFQVRALDDAAQCAQNNLRNAPRGNAPLKACTIDPPAFTRKHSHAQVQTVRVSHANDDEYLGRMDKRQRVS